MGIADLLTMLQGGAGAQAGLSQAGGQAPPPQGIGAFLGGGDADPGAQDQATPYTPPQAAPQAPQAGAVPVPSTPPSDTGDSGLSGFLSHMVQKATTRNDDTGMSFMDRLGRFGGQMTDMSGDSRGAADRYTQAGAQRVEDAAASEKAAKMSQLADSLGMSPREKLLFLANPDQWAKANGSALESTTVDGGATRHNPLNPSADFSAPKYGQENGEGFSSTPDATKDTGGLAMSPAQVAQDRAREASQKALELYHQLMVQNGAKNAEAHMISATKPRAAGGGGGLPPGY